MLKVEEIKPGYGAYNLACVSALAGKGVECPEWLNKSKEKGFLLKKRHLEQDHDLDSVRELDWFKEFMEGVG